MRAAALTFSICFVAWQGCGTAYADEKVEADRLSSTLGWLPENSETLVVANGPFAFADQKKSREGLIHSARCCLPLLVTNEMRKGKLGEQLAGREVLLAVEAGRRFIAPKELGVMPFEGCEIIVFATKERDFLAGIVADLFEEAKDTHFFGKTRVAVFEEEWQDDKWSLFVAQPSADVLLVATAKSFLEEVLSRMNGTGGERAFAVDFAEWKHIDRTAALWGIRHYRKEFADTDPTSPLASGEAPGNVPDPQAIGLAFHIYDNDTVSSRVRYLTKCADALEVFSGQWDRPNSRLKPTLVTGDASVVEVVADYNKAFEFLLLIYLGHGIYV